MEQNTKNGPTAAQEGAQGAQGAQTTEYAQEVVETQEGGPAAQETRQEEVGQGLLFPDDWKLDNLEAFQPTFNRYLPVVDLPPDDELLGEPPAAQFLATLRLFGVVTPVWVIATGQKKKPYRLVAGRNRTKGARAVGLETIPALVFPKGTPVGDLLTLLENQRRGNPAADVAAIKQLIKGGANREQIQAAVGLSPVTLEARLRLAALDPFLLDLYGRGRMKATTAERAAKLNQTDQASLVELMRSKLAVNASACLTYGEVGAITKKGTADPLDALAGASALFETPDQAARPWQTVAREYVLLAAQAIPSGVSSELEDLRNQLQGLAGQVAQS